MERVRTDKRQEHSFEERSDYKKVKLGKPSYAFLETIDKKKLDLDSEKTCSVTLSSINVYCCLVCGKYLQGRRPNTPAFLHSVNDGHHIYVNFNTLKFYLLPEGTEVQDNGTIQLLNSLRYAIMPTFTKSEIEQFPKRCVDLSDNQYTNGFVGMNYNSENKAINVVLLAIAHLAPLRDYLLLADFGKEDEFIRRLGIVVRKLWSVKLFKPHVSAEEFVSFALVNDSKAERCMKDPRRCLLWLLDCITSHSSVLKKLAEAHCRGVILTSKTMVKTIYDDDHNVKEFVRETANVDKSLPFWMLTLDLPPRPLFRKGLNVNDLPQVRLEELMKKFNGQTERQMPNHILKYRLLKAPKYLIIHFDRFDTKTQQPVKNRNQTIVEFPLEMVIENHRYMLVANIIHEGVKSSNEADIDEESRWAVQLYNEKADEWFQFNGTTVKKREKELLFLRETYVQIWQRKAS